MAQAVTSRLSFQPVLGLSTWVTLEKPSSPCLSLGPFTNKFRRESEGTLRSVLVWQDQQN